jgi:branched-chain amino acid transport system substrate-binding protein
MVTTGRVAVAALLAVLPSGAGPSGRREEVQPRRYRYRDQIGQTMSYSGPASADGNIGKAMVAYFAKLNDEGGIDARPTPFS